MTVNKSISGREAIDGYFVHGAEQSLQTPEGRKP